MAEEEDSAKNKEKSDVVLPVNEDHQKNEKGPDRFLPLKRQLFCCSSAIITPLTPALLSQREPSKSNDYMTVVPSNVYENVPRIGEFVGAIASVLCLHTMGRKKTLIVTNLLFLVPLLVFLSDLDLRIDFAGAMVWHIAGRFQAATISLYIAEVTDASFRAPFIGLYFVADQFGRYVGQVAPQDSSVLVLVALVVTVVAVIASFQAVETPYWLTVRGERAKGEAVYKWLRSGADDEATAAAATQLVDKAEGDTELPYFSTILSKQFWIPLSVVTALYCTNTNLKHLHNDDYANLIANHGYHKDDTLDRPFLFNKSLFSNLMFGLPLVGCVWFLVLCLLLGRRILFFSSILVHITLVAANALVDVSRLIPLYSYAASPMMEYLGAKQIPRILSAEIFPAITRDFGVALCEFLEVAFDTFDDYGIKKGKNEWYYHAAVNIRWTLIPIGFAYTYYYMPETRNLNLVETEELGSKIQVP